MFAFGSRAYAGTASLDLLVIPVVGLRLECRCPVNAPLGLITPLIRSEACIIIDPQYALGPSHPMHDVFVGKLLNGRVLIVAEFTLAMPRIAKKTA